MSIFLLSLQLLFELSCLPFVLIYSEWKFQKELKECLKNWEANSFLYDGGRYSKDFFELVDGKPVRKEKL